MNMSFKQQLAVCLLILAAGGASAQSKIKDGSVSSTSSLPAAGSLLLASPDGAQGSLQLRQQVWIHHLDLQPGEEQTLTINGPRAYLQSIHGTIAATGERHEEQRLTCGDGAFVREENRLTVRAETPLRALLIDLPV